MTTSRVERSSTLSILGLVIAVAAVFVLPVPPVLSIGLAIFGFALTMFEGRSIYRLMAGGLVAWSVFVLLMARAASPDDAPDLEEPIPVPSGYGFELDQRSTNGEHLYRSRSMPLGRARSAAVEVVDHYVDALTPAWTVIDRNDRPDLSSMVELRQGDSSRGISIWVGVVEPFGRPAFLDLRIQALYCTDDLPGRSSSEVTCMTAPIRDLVRYPGGEPVVTSPQPSPEPLREPVPVPSGYGFSVDTGLTSEGVHAYRSAIMGIPEARRAERLVLRYYRQALDDWIIVAKDERNLLIKDPDSTDGLAIRADSRVWVGEISGVVELEIRAILCPDDHSCNWVPPGA
jgi:hypothetical protein